MHSYHTHSHNVTNIIADRTMALKGGRRKKEKVSTSHRGPFLIRKSKFHKTLSTGAFSCVRGQHWVMCQVTAANKTEKLKGRVVMNSFHHSPHLGVGLMVTAHKIRV